MSYTILNVAYPFTHVGPDASGGSEQILYLLDRQLTRLGYRSLVLAVEGSQVEGELIPAPGTTRVMNAEVRRWGQRVHQRLLLETLNKYPVDLVHMHALDFHAYLPASSIPTLATLHLPVDWYPKQIFHQPRRNFAVNCVSFSQQAMCPASDKLIPYIRNGVDVDSFLNDRQRDETVVAIGRICPEKGFHLALDAARAAGVPMMLAGEIFPYEGHLLYFQREIAPRLDSMRRFIGQVHGDRKRELLASAKALLVPSQVAETSSLVTMEALSSGTPVISFGAGAIPELVEHGRTGFIVSSVEEMADAIGAVDGLRREECRRAVEARCDHRRMCNEYVKAYGQMILAARSAPANRVRSGLSWLADVG